jgi:hypothetical protein
MRRRRRVFLTGAEEGAYMAGEPKDDARFVSVFAHSLEHTGGYTPEDATRVAGTLLPDILFYDPTRPAAFPDNGRSLADDVADIFITIITDGKRTSDYVGSPQRPARRFSLRGAAAQGPLSAMSCRLSVGDVAAYGTPESLLVQLLVALPGSG